LWGSVSALALAAPALAQTASSGSVEEVIVTATKRAEQVQNVPMAVTVVGGDTLDKLNARSFEDLLASVPGLSITAASPTHPDLILRGINAGGVGSTVSTYVDETPFGSSNALANAAITSPNFDTYDLARVEVLRGPQGTLYGASAEGGLLKFVTNAPNPAGWDASAELGGFNVDNGGWGGSARAMANVPLMDDLAVRGTFAYQRTPGYIDNAFTGHDDTNHLLSEGGRLSALYQPTNKLSVRLTAVWQKLSAGNTDAEDIVLVGDSFHPKYGDYIQKRAANEISGVRYYLYNGTLDWDLDWATFTSSTSYGLFHDVVLQDATAVFGYVQGFVKQGKFTQEVRLASNPGPSPFEWLVGGYYTNETSTLDQDIVTSFHGPLVLPGAFLALDSNYNEKAVFANATYHFSPAFDVSFGGRYSSNSQHALQTAGTPLLQPQGPELGQSSGDVFTWSADARYHLNDSTMIYGRVATGFRPGGPNVAPIGGATGAPSSYNSDSLREYELGVKGTLADANLAFDADVFLINWKDIQLLALVNNTGVNANGGTARSQGVEADVTWTPVERLTLNLNGAYTDAHLSEDVPATVALFVDGRKGDPLPWTPKWSVSLSGDYQFMPVGDFTPYLGATWRYSDPRKSDFLGQLTEVTPGVNQYTIPSYSTLDLRGGVDWNSWALELYAKNLNNAKGITGFAATGISVANGQAGSATVIQPRVVGAVLRWKF
jgi:outer membrane receptor protein involved in Fe transport